MMQGLFQRGGPSLKNAYIICTSWIKHYLFDSRAKFDIFSGYESSLIFLSYLHVIGNLKLIKDVQPPSQWLTINHEIDNITDFFLDFLEFIACDLPMAT